MLSPLLAISDRRSLPGGDLPPWAAELGRLGVGALLLREKDLGDRALFGLATAVRRHFPAPGKLLISGRADLALAVGADGVHLPAAGLPTRLLRQRWGRQLLLGRSTHSVEEVEAEACCGADYVTFGPVYSTASKASFGPPLGLEGLARACRAGLPVFALGGVSLDRLAEVAGAGAAGAAGISCFQQTGRVAELVAAGRRLFPAGERTAPESEEPRR